MTESRDPGPPLSYESEANPSTSTDAEVSAASFSDEISETTSLCSERIVQTSSSSQKNTIHMKKHLQIVNKMKGEIALLTDSLAKTDYADLHTLQTRLRMNALDMKRVRQHNIELKDRIQSLEERLYNALQREILLTEELNKTRTASFPSPSPPPVEEDDSIFVDCADQDPTAHCSH